MEWALWDLIQPFAKQSDPFGAPPHAGDNEGQHVWRCLLESYFDVAQRCAEACRKELRKFELHRERMTKIMQEFGSLCVEDFQD
eukprot:7613415-Pyramimonas_sp.AAC.1